MASDIRIETGFLDHPKTKLVRRRLGVCAAEIIMRLWFWAADHKADGDLSGMSDEMIELAVDWEGQAGIFVSAMLEARYLEGDENERKLHEWAEHQPWVSNRGARSESARIAATARWDRAKQARQVVDSSKNDAERMRDACEPDADSNAPNPTQPNPTQHQPSKTKPARASLALPDWLPIDPWVAFVEMRKRMRSPLTDRAVMLAIGELETLRAQGQDVAKVLDQSTVNGWKGLFPVKVNGSNGHRAPPQRSDSTYLNDNRGELLARMTKQTQG